MLKLLFSWILLGLFCTCAWSQDLSGSELDSPPTTKKTATSSGDEKRVESILFNFGTHTEFYNNVQTSVGGETRKIDWKAPTIGAGLSVPMSPRFRFLPELNWVLPRTPGTSKIIKNLLMYRADFGFDALDWLRLRLGTSIMHANQHGRGGKAKLNNGNTTSTFYYPDENRSSLNNTLDLGIEGRYEDFSLRLQTYIYSLFIEEKRQVSYTLFITYYWDR